MRLTGVHQSLSSSQNLRMPRRGSKGRLILGQFFPELLHQTELLSARESCQGDRACSHTQKLKTHWE
jgi:hypothetical protein